VQEGRVYGRGRRNTGGTKGRQNESPGLDQGISNPQTISFLESDLRKGGRGAARFEKRRSGAEKDPE